MHGCHQCHARQACHDPLTAAPFDPDQHQRADWRISDVAARNRSEAQNFAVLLQARKPDAHGCTADSKPVCQCHDRGAPVAAQLRDQFLIQIVHIETITCQIDQFTHQNSKMSSCEFPDMRSIVLKNRR